MFNTISHRAKLIAHKEGKLKSYGSCLDVRAWSHDDDRRSSYLRDWIRRDIPVCVLPAVLALTRHLRNMTRKRRTTLVPPCSHECRSKIILDNIYESCHAIKECLRNEEGFQNVFEKEEFETSYWPCERCVEILKSIKLFWNIVLEKLLKITFPINEEFDDKKTKSIHELARQWKEEIVDQTLKVRNLQSLSKNRIGIHIKDSQTINQVINNQGKRINDPLCNDFNRKRKRHKDECTNTNFLLDKGKIKNATKSKNIYATVEKRDISCNTSFKSLTYLGKKDLSYLKQRLEMQETKIKQLENENNTLKSKLKNRTRDVPSSTASNMSADLKTIDDYSEDEFETIKDIASEMIITLKNCTNKSYRNISVLQVLHKSNATPADTSDHHCNKNPTDVLNIVHERFNAIVKRELCIAKENKNYRVDKTSTSYQEISVSQTSFTSTASKFKNVDR